MASAGINFNNLTPSNGAIQSLRELIFLALVDVETIGNLVKFMPKQKHGDKLGFVGEFGLLGKAHQGCDPTYANDLVNTSEKTWDIKRWEIAEALCYADLEGTVAALALKTKTNVADLTGTEYMDEIVAPLLERAVKKLILRFAFFGDKNASTYDPDDHTTGTLKPGVDAGYFNLINGFFQQIFAGVAAGTISRVVVDANTKTTSALQKAAIKTAGAATGIMDELIESASPVLRQLTGKRIYVTQALADALAADIKANNKGSELQWEAIFDGITKTTYNGIEVVALPFWDEIIQGYLQNNTNVGAWDKPYRAIFTIKDNLLVGSESEDAVADINIFFDQKTKKNYIDAMDTIGALIGQDNLINVAY